MSSEQPGDDAPSLPPFPDLSPLAAAFPSSSSPSPPSTSPVPPPTDDDPSNIWASVPSSHPHRTVDTSGYHAQYLSSPPPPPPDLDDLDPFSPRYQTLGQVVDKNSRLELIADSESEGGGNSPVEANKAFAAEQAERKGAGQAELGHKRVGSGSFFGNVFRSISGTPSREQQQQARSSPAPPLPAPSPSLAGPSTPSSSSHPHDAPPPSHAAAPQTPSGPSTLAKPFTSIASVFRSTPKASPSTTPQPGSSPVLREKGAFMTAIVGSGGGGKGKEKASEGADEHAHHEYDEKTGMVVKGKEKEQQRGAGVAGEKGEPTFDFNRFLEQMRMRSADPIAKYLRSFLKEFSRRPPGSTSDQTRVINDFLDFIAGKMRQTDPWKSIVEVENRDDPERGEAEFDMAMEAMEKLVMNRLWHLTFTPALDLSLFPGHMSPSGDVERDHVLSQRIRLFQWIEPKHLDLPIPSSSASSANPPAPSSASSAETGSAPTSPKPQQQGEAPCSPSSAAAREPSDAPPSAPPSPDKDKKEGKTGGGRKHVQGFLDFAQRELCKMNQYKAPRDKLICVLNCCKVIFGLMRHVAAGEEGADAFIPFLIFVVLKANPENLVSNLQYIQRFRNPEKLSGEGGYYLSSLNAAISFIETLDASSLSNITQAEFETYVAGAVKKLAAEEPPPPVPPLDRRPSAFEAASRTSRPSSPTGAPPRFPSPANDPTQAPLAASEAESASAALVLPSGEAPSSVSFPESTRQLLLRGTDSVEKAMSKPLGALAKIFEQLEQTANEITGQQQPPPGHYPQHPPYPPAPLPPSPTPSHHSLLPHKPQTYPITQPSARPNPHKRRSYLAAPVPSRPGLPPLPPSTGSLHLRSPPSPDPALYVPETVGDEEVLREIDRQHEEQRMASLGTLESVFPGLEREVLEMVLLSSGNDVGKAIDSLLEMA
ncbi:hypothetical protein JCM8547_004190 [Rhodosporidiobolus lusitaniae]